VAVHYFLKAATRNSISAYFEQGSNQGSNHVTQKSVSRNFKYHGMVVKHEISF
jgi:hypothetical protein